MKKALLFAVVLNALLGILAVSEVRADPALSPVEGLACTASSPGSPASVSLTSAPCFSPEDPQAGCFAQAQPQERPQDLLLTPQPKISTTAFAHTSPSFRLPLALPSSMAVVERGGALRFLPTVVLRV